MGRKFRVSRAAKNDLDDIWLFIAQDKIEAADRFIDFLSEKFPLLASSPGMGRQRSELVSGLWSFPVGNYLIFYRQQTSGIEIVRVIHGARDLKSHFT